MIKINLNLFATLSSRLPEHHDDYAVEEGTDIASLIRDLDIPVDQVKLVFVNGKIQPLDYKLKNNDRLGLFPPVGGG